MMHAPGRDPRDYERVLVIRLGALGDFVQSLGPMAAVRRHHRKAEIVLLTTTPFAALAKASPYFDAVWIDTRPKWWQGLSWWGLIRKLRRGRFDRVYDLQTSQRSARYWSLMGRPEWSGHVEGCSHPDLDPKRDALHTIERQAGQLAAAGIEKVPLTDLSWVAASATRFSLPPRYVLIVPGGSAHRPEKRWPAEKFANLARWLVQQAVTPVILGAAADGAIVKDIMARAPDALNLCGKTSLADIVGLARGALGAAGNDTGPMHLIAMAGCPSLVLFSSDSDPALCAPRPGIDGGRVAILRRPILNALSVAEVQAALPFSLTGGL
jgi:ADP-heptose:LPS heptosyltransferase